MKKKKGRKLKWIILSIPITIMLIGVTVIGVFGWEMTKQTVLLAKQVAIPYKPNIEHKDFKTEVWPTIPSPGEGLGELSIPSIDLSYPVVQGTHRGELRHGIGHFAGSTLPGQGGHVLLSGHRETHFSSLKHLEIGDEIVFTTPYGDFIYETINLEIVDAKDTTVAVPTDYETLTLTTCYPFNYIGNAPDRFIVYTKLIKNPLKTVQIN